MLQTKPLELGKLKGTIYDFPEVGDELALHVHTEEDVHISVVARGKLKAFGPDEQWVQEVSAGAVLDWEPGQYHGFIALEPNTRLVNIIKG
jgi:quercetin dioxygenase-like cupin family protein